MKQATTLPEKTKYLSKTEKLSILKNIEPTQKINKKVDLQPHLVGMAMFE